MPITFASMYPRTWAATSTLFSATPQTVASANVAAVQGLRKAYVQKYAPKAATTAQTDNARGDRASRAKIAGCRAAWVMQGSRGIIRLESKRANLPRRREEQAKTEEIGRAKPRVTTRRTRSEPVQRLAASCPR